MEEVVIRLEGVSKYYKLYNDPTDRIKEAINPLGKEYHSKFYALNNINLEVNKGELLGIVGENGCGKSTLLKIVSSVLMPDKGIVETRGRISALLELGSGFNPEFTGMQNIYFYGIVLGISKSDIDLKLDEILSFADIGEFIHQPLKTYSSGMKARLSFSVASVVEPEILILDEVLSVGDAKFKRKSAKRMQSMMDSGCTVLLVSHSEDSINHLCSKAVYLRNGEIAVTGEPKSVTKLYLKASASKALVDNDMIRQEMKVIESDEVVVDEKIVCATDESFFSDQVFQLSNPVVMNNALIELIKIEILNNKNEAVNILEYGKKYRLVVRYEFSDACDEVVFPITFHTEKGQMIFGVRNPDDGGHYSVASNEVAETIVDFTCNFTRGMYYVSVGVVSFSTGEREILYTMDDAVSFKVIQDKKICHWGIMSTGLCELQFKTISA